MQADRITKVKFVHSRLFESYQHLKQGTSEEKELASDLEQAFLVLKENPVAGIKIPGKLWPKEYVTKYGIKSLFKCNLPNGWRLVYTLEGTNFEVVVIVLEWFNHKDYEKRFGYKSK